MRRKCNKNDKKKTFDGYKQCNVKPQKSSLKNLEQTHYLHFIHRISNAFHVNWSVCVCLQAMWVWNSFRIIWNECVNWSRSETWRFQTKRNNFQHQKAYYQTYISLWIFGDCFTLYIRCYFFLFLLLFFISFQHVCVAFELMPYTTYHNTNYCYVFYLNKSNVRNGRKEKNDQITLYLPTHLRKCD